MIIKWYSYGGLICRKNDIKKEARAKHFSPAFETRESHTELEVKQQERLGIWCESCQQLTVHICIGRSRKRENTYKCNNCGLTKTLIFGE